MNKTISLALLLTLSNLAATSQTSCEVTAIRHEVEHLSRSKALQTKWGDNAQTYFSSRLYAEDKLLPQRKHSLPKHNILYFKYLEEVSDPAKEADTPTDIRKMEQTFDKQTSHAARVVVRRSNHDSNHDKQFSGLTFTFRDSVGGFTAFSYPADSLTSFHSATFKNDDGSLSNFTFAWRPMLIKDRHQKLYRIIDGYVAELTGNDWKCTDYNDYQSKARNKHEMCSNETIGNDTVAGYIVENQVAMLMEEYRKCLADGKPKLCDSIAAMVKRLAGQFDGTLSISQHQAISKCIRDVIPGKIGQREETLLDACSLFGQKKMDGKALPYRTALTKAMRPAGFYATLFPCCSNTRQMIAETLNYANMASTEPTITININGATSLGGDNITIGGTQLDAKSTITPVDGKFSFSASKLNNSIIWVSNGRATYFAIADSVPLYIDMDYGITAGSDINMKFRAVQDTLKAFRKEAIKYATTIDGLLTITDSNGLSRLEQEYKEYVTRTIKANKDNAIHVFLLYKHYTMIEPEELMELANTTGRFADNVLMEPVRNYIDALRKLKPGMKLAETECLDTAGRKRTTTEFLGNRYTIMHYYYPQYSHGSTETQHLKHLYERYHDQGLAIVCHAMTFGFNSDIWQWQIKRNGMERFSNIFGGPAATLNGITITPTTLILNAEGRIVANGLDGNSIAQKIEEFFDKSQTTSNK